MREFSQLPRSGKVGGQYLDGPAIPNRNNIEAEGLVDAPARSEHGGWLTGQLVPNYLGVAPRFASSCTDFVVADLSIIDLVGKRHAVGGFVICFANTR